MSEKIPPIVEQLLTSEPLVAHLATCRDGRPHVAPLWYRYENETIEIMTTGKKLANIRSNPNVALSIQKDEDGHPDWRVTLRGTANIIDDKQIEKRQNRKLNRKYGADDDDWLEENTLVRIDVDSTISERF